MWARLDTWHKTRQGHIVFAVVELLLAYLVASRALDTGSLIEWTLAIILLIGAMVNLIQLVVFWKQG